MAFQYDYDEFDKHILICSAEPLYDILEENDILETLRDSPRNLPFHLLQSPYLQ